jgi:Na+/proline symporter
MEALLLSAHVLAGILFIGAVAVVVSPFPRYAPVTEGAPGAASGTRNAGVASALHRITRVYGRLAIAVPLVGIALALVQGRMGEVWITVAMVLTAVAGALLVLQIAPRQKEALDAPDDGAQLRRLGMLAGVFNLLWAVVVVMMVVRPGSDYV